MSDTNTSTEQQVAQDAPKKPKAKTLVYTEDKNADLRVIVMEPKTKGSGENAWEVFPVCLQERGQQEGTWYELSVVQGSVSLTPDDAYDLAMGGHVLKEKPRSAEEQAKRADEGRSTAPDLLVLQAYPHEDTVPNKAKPGENFVNRTLRVVMADAIYPKADVRREGEPIGFKMLAIPGDRAKGEKGVYATMWRSPWPRSLSDAQDPQQPLRPLELVEAFAVVRDGATVYRESAENGEIQIKALPLKVDPNAKGSPAIEFEPFQPMRQQSNSQHYQQEQGQGRGARR